MRYLHVKTVKNNGKMENKVNSWNN